ncbi:MAG: beta-ketoacyl-ACP synthase II [Armatimonadetes bacterium]|nr:beta-ketoacyl-ACP synthase II [Armatimonadota bacterium]
MNPEYRPSGRVVVTGIGLVTALGTGVEKSWTRLVAGENPVDFVKSFDVSEYSTRFAAEVTDFDASEWMEGKEARRIDPFIAYAVSGAAQALKDSGLVVDDSNREDIGVLIGAGIGGLGFLGAQHRRLVESGPSKVSPFLVPYMIPDMASGYVSILNGLKGPISCVVTACATGANALGDAAEIIRRGDAVAMVAGGAEAPINEIGMSGFCSIRAMSGRNDDPKRASRPFDKDRDGFVIGEGAGVMILEDYDHAVARGAKIYGELVGYGMSADAYHITATSPDGDGAIRSMAMAVRKAGITPDKVDYINAHGTSTPYNDSSETKAIKSVFGDHAHKLAISSTKSMLGHSLGATGAVEAIFCILAMRDSVVPPTINYETPDPECDLDYVPNVCRKMEVNYALTNSFGFGGKNASLLFKKL